MPLNLTLNFGAASPTYEDITPDGVTICYHMVLDPWNPSTRLWLATDVGVYECVDYKSPSRVWSLYYDYGSGLGAFWLSASIRMENFLAVAWRADVDTMVFAHTTDDGENWTESGPLNNATTTTGLAIPQHLLGLEHRVYMTTGNNDERLRRSDDSGETFSQLQLWPDDTHEQPVACHSPYPNNKDGNTFYFASEDKGIYRTTDGGATVSHFGRSVGSYVRHGGLEVHTEDPDHVWIWQRDGTLAITKDGGQNWIEPALNGLSGTVIGAGGFPTKADQYYAITTEGIFVTTDGGNNWIDKTGDWTPSFSPHTDPIPYHGVIVPDWTE